MLIPAEAARLCRKKYRNGEYDAPENWPGASPPQEVYDAERRERDRAGATEGLSRGLSPLDAWLAARERARLKVAAFEYQWLETHQPALLEHCWKRSLPKPWCAVVVVCVLWAALAALAGLAGGSVVHWVMLRLHVDWPAWILSLIFGVPLAMALACSVIRHEKKLREEYHLELDAALHPY